MTTRIQTFLSSLSDLNTAAELISDDATFIAVRAQSYEKVPIYGTFTGTEGLKTFAAGLRSAFDTQTFEIDHVLENHIFGAAFGRFHHRVRRTGKHFKSHWALKCEFQDDKITSYQFYEDTAALEEAMNTHTNCKETI